MGKGQINIDLVFGYLAFVIFIWYFTGYMGDLFTPFTDYAKLEYNEKKDLLNRNEVASLINLDNIGEVCNLTLSGKYGNEVSYEIKGFNVFEKDDDFTYPNQTSGSVLVIRDYDSFTILAGTNFSEFNASITFTIPYNLVRVDPFSVSSLDYFNQSFDDYGNIVFDVNLFANETNRLAGYTFHTSFTRDEFLIIEYFSQPFSKLLVGSVKASDSCSEGSETGSQSFYNFFKKIGYGKNEFYGLISIKTWWVE